MIQKETKLKHYLSLMKRFDITPNFFISEEYLMANQAICYEKDFWVWIEADEWAIFPPLNEILHLNGNLPIWWDKPIWSDFESFNIKHIGFEKSELDKEYIFNPAAFNDLSGGQWKVYRKNIRKYPKRHEIGVYRNVNISYSNVTALIGEWMENKPDFQGIEELIAYIDDAICINCKGLFVNNLLVAINMWDENYKYINYRYCFTKPNESFLEEYVRYLFYTDPEIQAKNKLVNDGGIVDNPGLEKFKDKLNPIKKRIVYSLIPK